MKTKILNWLLAIFIVCSIRASAQTSCQFVTIATTNANAVSYQVQSNQLITLIGYDWEQRVDISGTLFNGTAITLTPYSIFVSAGASSQTSVFSQIPEMVTGLTNIVVSGGFSGAWATFKLETPTTANVISNYIPADAIVIPASATGSAQIILESSPDLINWTAANPGTYGLSAGTNRFFRVRAAISQ